MKWIYIITWLIWEATPIPCPNAKPVYTGGRKMATPKSQLCYDSKKVERKKTFSNKDSAIAYIKTVQFIEFRIDSTKKTAVKKSPAKPKKPVTKKKKK